MVGRGTEVRNMLINSVRKWAEKGVNGQAKTRDT